MDKWYIDTETCGFHGLPVILQYAINDGPVVIFEFWRRPIRETLALIEEMTKHQVIGFNLAFDWFMIQKVYNVFKAYHDHDALPQDIVDDLAELEMDARDGECVKPRSALDLMLHFRKTELQVTMERDDIRIRKVPTVLAPELAKTLTERIQLDPILFAAQKKWAPRFQVKAIDLDDGTTHPSLSDVVLVFKPGAGLKQLAQHLLGHKVKVFGDIEIDKAFRPKEYGYAPFAKAVGDRDNWNWSWPDVIKYHISHWAYREDAREYAANDVLYTRQLHEYTEWTSGGDTDSILACMVASCRWKGYKIIPEKLDKVIETYREKLKAPLAPNPVKKWINEVLTPMERVLVWRDGTSKKALQALMKAWVDEPSKKEAVARAKAVLEARKAKMKIQVLLKLKRAGRFHASFKVIGALSGRMSGSDKLNAQGIDKTKEVRGCFPLSFAEMGEILLGGDMKSFEISIAAADYGDEKLAELLTTCEEDDTRVEVINGILTCPTCIKKYSNWDGPKCEKCGLGLVFNEKNEPRCNRCYGAECKSFHAIFGMGFFPEMTYKEIRQSAGKTVGNVYNPSKNGAFATLYGAQPAKLADTIGVTEDQAVEGYHRFWRTFEAAGAKRKTIEAAFTSLHSEYMGGKIHYRVPEEYIESLLGYRRYFTLENYLIREIFNLASNIPKEWAALKIKVSRSRKGEQTAGSAVRSALYGCAFGLQNSCIRQAANHRIQSTGAGITKEIQVAIWGIQPVGVFKWLVRGMNVHDEIQCPTDPSVKDQVYQVVHEAVEKFRPIIPLIGIDFGQLGSWADK